MRGARWRSFPSGVSSANVLPHAPAGRTPGHSRSRRSPARVRRGSRPDIRRARRSSVPSGHEAGDDADELRRRGCPSGTSFRFVKQIVDALGIASFCGRSGRNRRPARRPALSTIRPESSARTGRPLAFMTASALRREFSSNVVPVSSTSISRPYSDSSAISKPSPDKIAEQLGELMLIFAGQDRLSCRAPPQISALCASKGMRSSICSPTPMNLTGICSASRHGDDDAALGRAVELGQHDAGDARASPGTAWPAGGRSGRSCRRGRAGPLCWRSAARGP